MKNLIYTKFTQCKYDAKKYQLRLNNGKDGQYRICSPILQPHVNRYESAVFTIFAFDFLLVCTSLHHICPEQICVNLILSHDRRHGEPMR